MKLIILTVIVVSILFIFRYFNRKSNEELSKNKTENIVDLEKDPKTNEYKPKE